jgi:hypothetical protein
MSNFSPLPTSCHQNSYFQEAGKGRVSLIILRHGLSGGVRMSFLFFLTGIVEVMS